MEIALLDVSHLLWITDVFLIATGTSNRHVKALSDAVEDALKGPDRKPLRREGLDTAEWVLLDYGDLVVHLFQEETREYYALERLWGDAPRLQWEPARLVE